MGVRASRLGWNVYYEPEKFGLKLVDEIEYMGRNSEFDTRAVWFQEATGKFLTARSAGHWAIPFEEDSLETLVSLDRDSLCREVRENGVRDGGGFIDRVRQAVVAATLQRAVT
jgi:hypothetical protein